MVWHGATIEDAGRIMLTEDQRLTLEKLCEKSEYWCSFRDFIEKNDGRRLSTLSKKQENWLYEGLASLRVEVWRHEARIASSLEPEEE